MPSIRMLGKETHLQATVGSRAASCNLCSLLSTSVYPALKWVSQQDPCLKRAVEGLNEMKPLEGLF